MTAKAIRCENDLKLYNTLLKRREVERVNEKISSLEEKGPMGTRRHLLATSVRLSRGMAPSVHKMADECIEKLGMNIPLELYAYSSPQFNAACFKPEEGRLFVMFSSSLLEAFASSELLFVMGHELGHHVYQHHDIPIGYILRGKQPPPADLALNLFAWSRYAEVSADRAGAYCAQDLPSVAKALFKLASGIVCQNVVQFDLDEFLHQLDDMMEFDAEPGQGAPKQDWFSTHPFSPLRVKALKLFHESALMIDKGFAKDELEIKVQDLMSLMEPNYIEAHTDTAKSMRRLFIAGAIAVADARNGISEQEQMVLQGFFEEGFDIDQLNSEKLRQILPERIKDTRKRASITQRMQVVRDLCIVARAEGDTAGEEQNALQEIALGLDVPLSFVIEQIEQPVELD